MSTYELPLIALLAALIVAFAASASRARAYRRKTEEALWTLNQQAQAVVEQSHGPATVTAHLYVGGKRLDADVQALAEAVGWQKRRLTGGFRR